jgi:hypothetical protein
MDRQTSSIGHAVRGLLIWTLASLIAVGCLLLLWYLLPIVGLDPGSGVNPRERPFAALAMCGIVLLVVLLVFYAAVTVALLVISLFVSRRELKAHFVEQLGSGKMLGPFHGWLFERIFGRQ